MILIFNTLMLLFSFTTAIKLHFIVDLTVSAASFKWFIGPTTVPSKSLTNANLPIYENQKKFVQTFKGCNSRPGIVFVQNKSFYGKTLSFDTKKLEHF